MYKWSKTEMYPCSTKTREVLGNPSPTPKRFPETQEISRGRSPREISRVEGNLERFPKAVGFAPQDPRDFQRAKPEGNPEGRGVQNPRLREISRAEGMDFPIPPESWWSTDILSSLTGRLLQPRPLVVDFELKLKSQGSRGNFEFLLEKVCIQ